MWRPHFRNAGTLASSRSNAEQSCTAHSSYSSTARDVVAFADYQPVSLFVGVVVFAMSVALAGCSTIAVVSPSNGQQNVPSPVSACVAWNDSGFTSLKFTVDGVDKTSSFAITNGASATCSLPSNYTGTTAGTATASLQLNPGNHSLVAAGDYYFAGTIHTSDTSNFSVIAPSFSLTPSPNPLQLAPGAHGTLTVNVTSVGGFNSAISATLTGLPSGVTASPGALAIPAGSASGQFTITAPATASPGSSTVTVNGNSGTLTSNPTFTLSIVAPTPAISAVTPTLQSKGGTITVTGTNFSATCANDSASLGGVNNISPLSPCSATSLKFQVPQQASFGATTLSVTTSGHTSNSVAFTVARAPGAFTEITSNIEGQLSSRTCPGGTVQLNICAGPNCPAPTDPYTATYQRGTTHIGQPIGFHNTNSRVANLGGAGFSLCTVGVVLDADATSYSPQLMGIEFLDLVKGNIFPSGGFYTFNYVTPSQTASYVPRIFTSPDGTILIVVTASTIGPSELTAAAIDQVNVGNANQFCQSPTVSSSFSASITASNQVSASLAGTSCTLQIH